MSSIGVEKDSMYHLENCTERYLRTKETKPFLSLKREGEISCCVMSRKMDPGLVDF